MATKLIDKNEARVPFFGDKISFVTGLDPLGLQNPSTQAYSYLLPGLNNVTSRIRNYSFYCWLLSEYAKINGSTNHKDQKAFIRKAEYIIALISVHAKIPSISGSNYAANRFKEGFTEFSLQKGTYNDDGTTVDTYWQYSYGIFGQYYLGSLRQIGLIEERENTQGELMGIFFRSSKKSNLNVSGEELAAAFDANINPKNKKLFFNCIENDSIKLKNLDDLSEDFNLTEIKNNLESELLIKLLVDVDEPGIGAVEPVSMRKKTLIHLLKYIQQTDEEFNQRGFTMYTYDCKGKQGKLVDDCLTGWYYYQLNDYFQLANTAIFNGCLQILEEQVGPGWMPLNDLILTSKNQIIDVLNTKYSIGLNDKTIDHVLKLKIEREKKLYEGILENNLSERMVFGFLLIWKLFDTNKENIAFLRTYTNTRNIGENDDAITYYSEFSNILNQPIGDFIYHFILNQIITRHQYVAYRKMGTGNQSTQKFIIEEQHIRQIGNFEPGFTSPRINSMISFLNDLKLLKDRRKLTKSGEKLLDKLTL